VLERTSGKIYYYKEDFTKMFVAQDKKHLVLSTREDNVEYAVNFLGINGKCREVKPFRIYDVLDNFKAVASFKQKLNEWTWVKKDGYYQGFTDDAFKDEDVYDGVGRADADDEATRGLSDFFIDRQLKGGR
jgi:hypothetical protein